MLSVFNSKNSGTFVIAKSILEKNQIPFIPKGENLAGLEYTAFEILVKPEDYERAKKIVAEIEENHTQLQSKFNNKHNSFFGVLLIGGILILVALLFWLGLWLREPN